MNISMTPKERVDRCKALGLSQGMLSQEDRIIARMQRKWDLTKFTTEELQGELEGRGYVNGVLLYPELDSDDE